MADWANENKTEFYRIYAKLLPNKIEGEVDNNVVISIRKI